IQAYEIRESLVEETPVTAKNPKRNQPENEMRDCDDDNVLLSGLTKLGIEDRPTRILAWRIPGWPATEAHSFACNWYYKSGSMHWGSNFSQLTISDKGCDDDNVLLSGLPKLGIEDSVTRILAWQIPGWPSTEALSLPCN
ncbi:hypothetical protein H5410_059196, partial [Solanum commersonii]